MIFGFLFAVVGVLAVWQMTTHFIIGAGRRNARNRSRPDPSLRPMGAPAIPVTLDFTTPNLVITFSCPINLNGIPKYLTNTGKLPISATLSAPNQMVLVYDTPGSVTSITIPDNDAAVRSRMGGAVPAGNFAVS